MLYREKLGQASAQAMRRYSTKVWDYRMDIILVVLIVEILLEI